MRKKLVEKLDNSANHHMGTHEEKTDCHHVEICENNADCHHTRTLEEKTDYTRGIEQIDRTREQEVLFDCIIYSHMREYSDLLPIRFHTPGHKGKSAGVIADGSLDITELGIDGEFFPSNYIERAQNFAADAFGAKYCKFLTNGSSSGLIAAILAVNCKILVAEYSHPSIFNGIKLAKCEKVIVKNITDCGLALPLTAEQIEEQLARDSSIGAVLITSPDYYGNCADIERVAAVTRRHKVVLIADSAHGAHYCLDSSFPISASRIADIAVMSGHKTLPVLTGASYMTVNDDEIYRKTAESLELISSTSPSYLLLASLEYGLRYTQRFASKYRELFLAVTRLKAVITTYPNSDWTRIVVDCKEGFGIETNNQLMKKGFFPEMADSRYVVFIVTINSTSGDIDSLTNALIEVINER